MSGRSIDGSRRGNSSGRDRPRYQISIILACNLHIIILSLNFLLARLIYIPHKYHTCHRASTSCGGWTTSYIFPYRYRRQLLKRSGEAPKLCRWRNQTSVSSCFRNVFMISPSSMRLGWSGQERGSQMPPLEKLFESSVGSVVPSSMIVLQRPFRSDNRMSAQLSDSASNSFNGPKK